MILTHFLRLIVFPALLPDSSMTTSEHCIVADVVVAATDAMQKANKIVMKRNINVFFEARIAVVRI